VVDRLREQLGMYVPRMQRRVLGVALASRLQGWGHVVHTERGCQRGWRRSSAAGCEKPYAA
jgi:hypothetical protein